MLMNRLKALAWLIALLSFGCSGNDNAHTTATTVVPPPPRQVLHIETRPSSKTPAKPYNSVMRVDLTQPLLTWGYGSTGSVVYSADEPFIIDFSLANAQLKGDGGQFRVRYIVDDEDMRWMDRWEAIVLTGWTPGFHTLRLELIGPDGWPYRNGDYNVETHKLTFIK